MATTAKRTVSYHKMKGTYRPSRHKQRPPDAGGIGDAPQHLDQALTSVWQELATALPPGVGATHDRAAFELLARLVMRMREGKVPANELAQLRGLLESFGLTPSGRTKLDIAPPLQRRSALDSFRRTELPQPLTRLAMFK